MSGVITKTLNHCRKNSGGDYSFSENRYLLEDFAWDAELFGLTQSGLAWLKDTRSTRAALVAGHFAKRYNDRGFWHRLKRRFQLPRPHRCLAAALHLSRHGIATPRVLAATFNVLVTEALPADCRLLNAPGALPDPEIADFLAQLHQAGVYHGDVNLRNLYRAGDTYGVIDLDGARLFPGAVPMHLRRKELARLISGWLRVARQAGWQVENWHAVAESFVRRYEQAAGIPLGDARLYRRVHYLTERIRRK